MEQYGTPATRAGGSRCLAIVIAVAGPEGARPSFRPNSNRWEGSGAAAG
jgi:hypothetical protein